MTIKSSNRAGFERWDKAAVFNRIEYPQTRRLTGHSGQLLNLHPQPSVCFDGAVTPEQFQAYVQDRYRGQVRYFDRRAVSAKRRYVVFQGGAIIFAVAAPMLVIALPPALKIITASISAMAAFFTTALKSFRFQENWTSARAMHALLDREYYLYLAGLDAYREAADRQTLFVERVEMLMAKESAVWLSSEKAAPEAQRTSAKAADTPSPAPAPVRLHVPADGAKPAVTPKPKPAPAPEPAAEPEPAHALPAEGDPA
ncbi:MAG: hypothetical protein JWO94_2812 [Verrucomicrobiaceae bacterium]|nr:hypothetical protein [Verrucomicrobiaceae bacterium]